MEFWLFTNTFIESTAAAKGSLCIGLQFSEIISEKALIINLKNVRRIIVFRKFLESFMIMIRIAILLSLTMQFFK